ncbi:hypothetical protein [Hymenobacter sp.]|uniref:hypothetical protein n=1 Tax=Hymenobacter sp. TaxID=1898978 RepID=UPI00286A1F41|nr:hypothetical protein [Hymenobacter sp.]
MRAFLLLSLFLSGCTILATKSKFAGKPSVAPGTLVALTTTRVSVPTGRGIEHDTLFAADSLFAKKLTVQLAAATGWRVIYVGEARNFKKLYPTSETFNLARLYGQLVLRS